MPDDEGTANTKGEQGPFRYRILVAGKSGAGKSFLINHAVNVLSNGDSNYASNVPDINEGIELPPNFILHDSQGFQHGELKRAEALKAFIDERQQRPQPQDRIHAIWLCTEIPVCGARVFETGDKHLLDLKSLEVPIIIVFTKYDLLIAAVDQDQSDEPTDDEAIKEKAATKFERTCIIPLDRVSTQCRRQCRRNPKYPHVEVSIKDRAGLDELIRKTLDAVQAPPPRLPGWQRLTGSLRRMAPQRLTPISNAL